MYDIEKLVGKEELPGLTRYTIQPSVIYPATAKRIREVLDGDNPAELALDFGSFPEPREFIKRFRRFERQHGKEVWNLALAPYDPKMSADQQTVREQAQGELLKYAKRALRAQLHGPGTMHIHIVYDEQDPAFDLAFSVKGKEV